MPLVSEPQPELMKGDAVDIDAKFAELMEVAVTGMPQSWNSMPSLKLACVARTNSRSSMPSTLLKNCSGGIVASPTPTVPISSDSIKVTDCVPFSAWARQAAAIHPAEPPPTIT
jgi:hypothetical protein